MVSRKITNQAINWLIKTVLFILLQSWLIGAILDASKRGWSVGLISRKHFGLRVLNIDAYQEDIVWSHFLNISFIILFAKCCNILNIVPSSFRLDSWKEKLFSLYDKKPEIGLRISYNEKTGILLLCPVPFQLAVKWRFTISYR